MTRVEGSAALRLDFDGGTTPTLRPAGRGNGRLHLASSGVRAAGPEKYRELERRRRAAQIKARHLLALMGEE
jgi:hypothetical protein